MKYNIFFNFYPSFRTFFYGSGSGFLADPDPDPDSEKKSDPDRGKKPGSETLESTVVVYAIYCPILRLSWGPLVGKWVSCC